MSADAVGKKIQKTIYFDPDVWEALEIHMKRERTNNVSIATNDALRFSLFAEFREDREASTSKSIAQLSNSLYEHRKKMARDMAILQEGMFKFVQEFFKHTTAIPTANVPAASAQAQIRLDEFMEELVRSVQRGKSIAETEEAT